jgi:hypothetical protein
MEYITLIHSPNISEIVFKTVNKLDVNRYIKIERYIKNHKSK